MEGKAGGEWAGCCRLWLSLRGTVLGKVLVWCLMLVLFVAGTGDVSSFVMLEVGRDG